MDAQELATLIDARIAADRQERARRRRRWLWPLIGLSLLSLAWSTWQAVRLVHAAQDWIAARDAEFTEAKLAYQRELAKNREWQRTRAAAEKALGYKPKQTQAEHEAALLNQALGLMTEQSKLREKWAKLDFEDPKSMEILADDMGRVLNQGMGTIGQAVLRNTDPQHNTREEKLRQDAAGDAVPAAGAPELKPAAGK